MDHPAPHRQLLVRRDDVDVVGFDRDGALDLHHRHLRAAAEQLGQMALLARIEVRSDNERQSGIGRHRAEELLQRLETARRRADADDRKTCHPSLEGWTLHSGNMAAGASFRSAGHHRALQLWT
jgi:hypothetical protein